MNNKYLISLICACWIISCSPKPSSQNLLVGTYTGEYSKGIYALTFDPDQGTLVNHGLAASLDNPSFLAIGKNWTNVYSYSAGKSSMVKSYKWIEETKKLELNNEVPVPGGGPCYIGVSPSEKMIAVANYGSGGGSIYQTEPDGSILENPFVFQHAGSGPDTTRQEAPHAHCSIFSKDNRFLFVPDLGIDQIKAYPIVNGVPQEGHTALTLDPGDGPRHFIFHPSGDFAFVINELSSTVMSLEVDRDNGLLTKIDKVSTLPEGFNDYNTCADLHITSNGKFLYASNRGHNSIAIFEVSDIGELKFLTTESTQGDWPRNFTLSPNEGHLLVANQRSGNITIFKTNEETGLLTYTGNELKMPQPVCLKF